MPLIFYTFAILCFLVALKQLRHLRNTQARLTFFVSVCAALSLIGYQLLISGQLSAIPQIFMLINVLPLLAILSMYFYSRYMVDIGFKVQPRHYAVIAILIAGYLAVLVPYWWLSADEKAEIIREIAGGKSLYSNRDPKVNGFSVLQISNVYFGLVGITAFSLACMQLLPHAFKGGTLRRPVFCASIFYLICLANAVLGTVSVVIDSFAALVVAGFIMGVPFGGLYFIGEFFPWAVYESKLDFDLPDIKDSEVVRRSYLKSVDIARVDTAVKVAMDEKRLFADPDLSLAALAAALGLSTHQLSEYLNRQLGKRFTRFINEYRTREAKRILETRPDETVRAVAREVGFLNEAYFSDIFLAETGVRPSDYRRRKGRNA